MVATEGQIEFHALLSNLFLLQSLPTYIVTRYIIVAPFGRHVPKERTKAYKWWFGPQFNAGISWFMFECPNLFWAWYSLRYLIDPGTFYLEQTDRVVSLEKDSLRISTNAILVALFVGHYINRAIIYPLRMNPGSQKVPLVIIIFAGAVTFWNGYIQCFHLVRIERYAPVSLPPSWNDAQHWLGISIFLLGMGINLHADSVLRSLRSSKSKLEQKKSQERVYYVPRSPIFAYISCPNFAGEILEWFGFAVASKFSLPSVAFFVYTASNLIPRAVAHHEWYLRKFEVDYPAERWAVIPFVV